MNLHVKRRQELFIHFEECVKKHFDFLKSMSYSVDKNIMGWNATYTSEKVEVNVFYERISFEIYSTILLKKKDVRCSIDEIVQHVYKRKFLFATDENMVENAVIELQELIIRYGNSFLNGDADAFENVLKEREESIKNYDLKAIEEKAVKAWENSNYDEVVMLYQSINGNLTPMQEKRLNISLKKMKK